MKTFLLTCVALMVVAGIYGATDMSVDLKNGELIEYEHVRERHAKHILAIIKTTGLPHSRDEEKSMEASSRKDQTVNSNKATREKEVVAKTGRTAVLTLEIFSRGDIEESLMIPSVEDEFRAISEATLVTGDIE